MIYSATKGISTVILHRELSQRGISADVAVSELWPEFGVNGKKEITVAQVLAHTSGLSQLPSSITSPDQILDTALMEAILAEASTDRFYGLPAYHTLTYGSLVSGILRGLTGESMRSLFQLHFREALGVESIWLGRPPETSNIAIAPIGDWGKLVARASQPAHRAASRRKIQPLRRLRPLIESFEVGDQTLEMFKHPEKYILDSAMPSANGVATADAISAIYAPLANRGLDQNGHQYLNEEYVARIGGKYSRQRDRVLGIPMSWRNGYHRSTFGDTVRGYGSVGMNGCFGWADPTSGISIGFVHNKGVRTIANDTAVFNRIVHAVQTAIKNSKN